MGLLDNIKGALKKGEEIAQAAAKKERAEKDEDWGDKVNDAVTPDAPADKPAAAPAPAPAAKPKAAAPKPAPKAAPKHKTYTVKKGDTLSEIGQQFGVPYMEIARLNNIENPDLIYPGQVFKIPNK